MNTATKAAPPASL